MLENYPRMSSSRLTVFGELADALPLIEALGGRDPIGDLAEAPLAEHPGDVSGIGVHCASTNRCHHPR